MHDDSWDIEEHERFEVGLNRILSSGEPLYKEFLVYEDQLWKINLITGWVDVHQKQTGLIIRIQNKEKLRVYTLLNTAQ